jgi:glycosyltransferase involved in cell wall biosynthesis
MKILQALNHFLPQQTAGTEVYTWALSKQLQQRGVDVKVVIPAYGKTESADYSFDGLNVHQYAEPSVVDRSLIMSMRKPDGLGSFTDYISSEKPNLVHFHELAGSNGITLHHVRAAKEYGAKVIMTFHLAGYTCRTGTLVYKGKDLCDGLISTGKCSSCYLDTKGYGTIANALVPVSMTLQKLGVDTTRWNHKLGTALGTAQLIKRLGVDFKILIDLCDQVVVLTAWYKEVLIRNGVDSSKICWIPQGLPKATNISPKVSTVATTPKPLRLLFLGRISPFKGLHLLLEALQEFPEDAVTLDIFGQLADTAYVEKCRLLTKGKTNIQWKGLLVQEEVVATIQHYDLLCLCSTFSEMSPLVIQEAFAAGIPVFASKVYGNVEQIRHNENGLLFTFNSVTSLQEQLRRCIDDPNLYNELKKNIPSARSFEEVASDYDLLYRKICIKKT